MNNDYQGADRRAMRDLDMMRDSLADAIVTALKRVANDPDFSKAFWQRGYTELAEHSSNGASQWLGKKIMVWAATAIVGSLIIWLVKTGAIK